MIKLGFNIHHGIINYYFTKIIINLKKEEKGFDAIDVILNVTNFLKMEGDLENDTKNEKSQN